MTELGAPAASAEVSIDADADTIYALITDLPTLATLAEEAEAMSWVKGDAVRPGAVFKGRNRNGRRTWSTTCTVSDAEPGHLFAFDVRYTVLPIARWRYDISSDGPGRCRVVESTWDQRPGWFSHLAGITTGVHDRVTANTQHIQATLGRLKERAEAATR